MLYEAVLAAAQAGTLSAEMLDSQIVEVCLGLAKRIDAQAVADYAAAASTKEGWQQATIPALHPPAGIFWLEWRIPKAANPECAGSHVGVLVEAVPGKAGTRLNVASFMGRTLMLYSEILFGALGDPTPDNLLDVVHDGRMQLLRHQHTRAPRRDDLYNATFAFVFLVPTLLHFLSEERGGLPSLPSLQIEATA